MLIVVIILLLLFFLGSFYGGPDRYGYGYGPYGVSLPGVLLILLLVWLLLGHRL